MSEASEKQVMRFSWNAVERDLIRALLTAAYDAAKQNDDKAKLAKLSDSALADEAERVLGSPPAPKHMDALTDVLKHEWLPRADEKVVAKLAETVRLGLTGEAKQSKLRNNKARIKFLRERNKTANFKTNLRKAFLQAHKEKLPVQTSTKVVEADTQPRRLAGEGLSDGITAYPHQLQAWQRLDELHSATEPAQRRGLLVLPTGAGKTYTMVRWLLNRMGNDPALRVLWIADRQELVDQAVRSFETVASTMPDDFERRIRPIHSAANPVTSLADPELDVSVITRQSLHGKLNDAAKKRIRAFLNERPVVVVVDEAHHAVAPEYANLLDFLQHEATPMLVGLTATPWPNAYGATQKLRERFPQSVVEVSISQLVENGVLAKPVFHTIDTRQRIELTTEERNQLNSYDVPSAVLRRLDQEARNLVIVNAWRDRTDHWGKTLVFAVDIEHADRLATMFEQRGADTLVVHSATELDRADALQRFRAARGPTVLVSVGMLTEGVDLPDARSVFLARPTRSRILMRQMIGRVLRGTPGGGEHLAHVVDVRDQWDQDVDVLAPPEIPLGPSVGTGGSDGQYRLPPVCDDNTGEPIPEDVLYGILRSYRERVRGQHVLSAMTDATLLGFYQLDELNLPVFDHSQERFDELIEARLAGRDLPVKSPIDLFDDLPMPRPSRRDLDALLAYLDLQCTRPPLAPVHATFSVRGVAEEMLRAQLSVAEQADWLRQRFDSSLARTRFGSFQSFYEAVQQELLAINTPDRPVDPENPRGKSAIQSPRSLTPSEDRDLAQLFKQVVNQAREVLAVADAGYLPLLEEVPKVEWTKRPNRSRFAYWAPRISGKGVGNPIIRVNRALCAARSEVPDGILEFLLWHELVHHLLPGQGHDAEFRRLEALWPDSTEQDYALDSLTPML